MVRVTDARMSGTSFGTVVLHAAPEAAVGGPLDLVEDGDLVEIDVYARRIDLLVDDDTLSQRRRRRSEERVADTVARLARAVPTPRHPGRHGLRSRLPDPPLRCPSGADPPSCRPLVNHTATRSPRRRSPCPLHPSPACCRCCRPPSEPTGRSTMPRCAARRSGACGSGCDGLVIGMVSEVVRLDDVERAAVTRDARPGGPGGRGRAGGERGRGEHSGRPHPGPGCRRRRATALMVDAADGAGAMRRHCTATTLLGRRGYRTADRRPGRQRLRRTADVDPIPGRSAGRAR